MATGDMIKPMAVNQMLRETLKIPAKNTKVVLYVALLFLLPSSVLFLSDFFSVKPVLDDFVQKAIALSKTDPESPAYKLLLDGLMKDVRQFLGVGVIFWIISYLLSVFQLIITVYSSAMIYLGEQLTIKDVFSKVRRSWKGPLITTLLVSVSVLGYLVALVIMVSLLVLFFNGSTGLMVLGSVILAILAFVSLTYLTLFLQLGLVISVLEEGCYGARAFGKASKILKGRKSQGFKVSIILFGMMVVVYMVSSLVNGGIGHTATVTHLDLELVFLNLKGLFSLFTLVVYTVFYQDCKKCLGEGFVMLYTKLPISPGDADLP